MKTAFITGHHGFIGRHMCSALEDQGWDVTGVDVEYGGLETFLAETYSGQRYDLVIHCAALIGGRWGIDHNPLVTAENLALDARVFQWAVAWKQPRMVYFSSSAAYPVGVQGPNGLELSEDLIGPITFGAPDNIYGWSKLVGEQLAKKATAAGTKTYVFRPFSGYGKDQSTAYPFPAFIQRAQFEDMPFFKIWGDATSKRDWIHVDDIVRAVLAGVSADIDHPVNLCTGIGTTFRDLAFKICNQLGFDPTIEEDLEAPMGVHTRVGDPTKMYEFYTPKISLDEGIRRALCG